MSGEPWNTIRLSRQFLRNAVGSELPPAWARQSLQVTVKTVPSAVTVLTRRGVDAKAVSTTAAVGGGGAPGVELPSAAVSLSEDYAPRLRLGEPAVVGRVERGRCLLDLRTVEPEEDERLVEAVSRCMS